MHPADSRVGYAIGSYTQLREAMQATAEFVLARDDGRFATDKFITAASSYLFAGMGIGKAARSAGDAFRAGKELFGEAFSGAAKRISSGISGFASDNSGFVDLDAFGGKGSAGKSGTNPNALKYNGNGTWTSNAGVIYGKGSKDGNRVKHVLQHTIPNKLKPLHTIFNVDKSEVIGLVDEAWINKGQGILQTNGNVLYDINMGRAIGTNGEDTIRIITKGYSNNIVTAFPKGKGME